MSPLRANVRSRGLAVPSLVAFLATSAVIPMLVAFFATSAVAQEPAAPRVEELVVGPAKQGLAYIVSPKGAHLATVTQKGSRMVVIVDGVEGPKFDAIVALDIGYQVLFSADGTRHAYIGRSGDDFVLMVDGKELMRPGNAKDHSGQCPVSQLAFTASGKHLWFLETIARPLEKGGGTYPVVVWDGVAEMPGGVTPVISPDGEHHAYVATNPTDNKQQTVVLDGKPAGYSGMDPQFSGDGKHLFVRTWVPLEKGPDGKSSGQALQVLVDGKPWIKAQEATLFPAPVGDLVANVVRRFNGGTQAFLVVAGKKVEGSDASAIDRVTFSPDGKRFAAECRTAASAQFVVVDGKRGQEYSNVQGFAFSPDSGHYGYVAIMNGKYFMVVDGEESDGFLSVQDFTFGGGGKRNGYIAQADPSTKMLVIDGQPASAKALSILELRFSDDGARCAYLMNSGNAMHLVLDGAENTELLFRPFQRIPQGQASYVFSPDGKHVAGFAASAKDNQTTGLWVDGVLVLASQGLYEPTFTPDGKHLFWMTPDPRGGPLKIHADGVPCAQLASGYLLPSSTRTWEMGEDGVLTVLGQDGEKMKRLRITPSADTSVETMLAAAVKPAK